MAETKRPASGPPHAAPGSRAAHLAATRPTSAAAGGELALLRTVVLPGINGLTRRSIRAVLKKNRTLGTDLCVKRRLALDADTVASLCLARSGAVATRHRVARPCIRRRVENS